jgi:hypothetical protein
VIEEINQAMDPLMKRFQLRVIEAEELASYCEVLYVNETTGLRVSIEWMELRPFLRVYELKGGLMPGGSDFDIQTGKRRRSFDVDDLLAFRQAPNSPVGKMLGNRDVQPAVRLLQEYAHALEAVGEDVLRGRFDVFLELQRIVDERFENLRSKARRGLS